MKLTENQFLVATQGLKLSEQNKIIAHRILVNQENKPSIAEEHQLTRQRVNGIEKQVASNYYKRITELGLVPVDVLVKPETATTIREMEEIDLLAIKENAIHENST